MNISKTNNTNESLSAMDQLEYELRMALAEDDDDDGLEVNDEGCELDALRREAVGLAVEAGQHSQLH